MQKGTKSYPATEVELRNIHTRGIAIYNQLYYEVSGKVYIGTKEGRLKEYTRGNNADINIFNNQENINTNTIDIEVLKEKVVDLENTKASKCFAIAMGIVL